MPTTGNPVLNLSVFAVFVLITLYIVYRVSSRNVTASDYYAAGSSFTGAQNGVALSGDFLSAASFLGISGGIAAHGYDGFLYSVGWVVAWLYARYMNRNVDPGARDVEARYNDRMGGGVR